MKSLNVAHRGFSSRYPENTLLAFEEAIEADCDGIELDVQLSADGELVIIHDELVDRTTNGTGAVKDKTLRELRELDASGSFHGLYGINRIPTLMEYFDLIRGTDILTNIELKTSVFTYPGIEEKTLTLIDRYDLRARIVISSFNHYSVLRMQALAPDIAYGFLEESRLIDTPGYTASHHVQAVHPEFHMVDETFMEDAQKHGLAVNVWTVNTEEDMREMVDLGVGMIIGDHPDICRNVLCGF